jgi:hypothetical protein
VNGGPLMHHEGERLGGHDRVLRGGRELPSSGCDACPGRWGAGGRIGKPTRSSLRIDPAQRLRSASPRQPLRPRYRVVSWWATMRASSSQARVRPLPS